MASKVSVIVSEADQARCAGKTGLEQALVDARRRTLQLFSRYEAALGDGLRVPCSPELNLPLWELGHVGWFADWWIARNPQRHLGAQADPQAPRRAARQMARGTDADALYNSSTVAHDRRWQLDLPDAERTRSDLAESLAETLALLQQAPDDDAGLYFFRLALFHEDMHGEAAVYMAQTLGFDPEDSPPEVTTAGTPPAPPSLAVPAAEWTLGHAGPGFAFDNELKAHAVQIEAFDIDAHPVSWAQFLVFVESGSYGQRSFWSDAGWAWRESLGARALRYLRQNGNGAWEQQRSGAWQPLNPNAAACHLTAFEAEAWCRWAGRRLPTEGEWELAASTQPGFLWGQVWEWTASAFAPFPGFAPHPYVDYSLPWFDGRPVLKGASTATVPRMRHLKYRNYFPPERNDIVAGFRSAASNG
jgi:gamma-glutamyl hercynylcysteine S-oxide synthase